MTKAHRYKQGARVLYRGQFGNGPVEVATIVGTGEKNDTPVYDLDNGHWCYENQIVRAEASDND